MNTLEVIAKNKLALEVANANGGAKSKAYVIADIGGHDLGPNMAVISFVHAVHGFGLCMRGQDAHWGKDKHPIPIKTRRQEIHLFNLQSVII
jgi:hypothetical protein